jgi:hypothetical protein
MAISFSELEVGLKEDSLEIKKMMDYAESIIPYVGGVPSENSKYNSFSPSHLE